VLADVVIQPINCSDILKEKDITFTNGAWRIAIDVDMSPYEEAVATVKTYYLSGRTQEEMGIKFRDASNFCFAEHFGSKTV